MLEFKPRPNQKTVLDYTQGKMGVSAVPGSGKTQTLSYLAARLLVDGRVQDDQEILIVTLVNSAVDNFASRIGGFINQFGLLSDFGYRVRTLHGLAHDIVRERPDLVGLSDKFAIVDERESGEILKTAVRNYLKVNPDFILSWISETVDLQRSPYVYQQLEEMAVNLAKAYIRQSKDLECTPAIIQEKINRINDPHPLLVFGSEMYMAYQRGLNYRSAVDFDDLIRLALQSLRIEPQFLARLRYRWPYILEDEAQDSSRLQEEILRLLVGDEGNWVRVGDPNQAIYETFTTASPEYLRSFLHEPGVTGLDLPDSGRSMRSVITLANELIRWTMEDHPVFELRSALNLPFIRPTPPGDPQPNPEDRPDEIHLREERYSAEKEIETVTKSIRHFVAANPDQTVAVLVPRNERGVKMAEALKTAGIEIVELLQSSQSTRQTAEIMAVILRYLEEPINPNRMAAVYRILQSPTSKENQADERSQMIHQLLLGCKNIEEFLWPRPGRDWLGNLANQGAHPAILEDLIFFKDRLQRWQDATQLPIDQLILTIAQEIFTSPVELALAHKLALVLEQTASAHPEYRLANFVEELNLVAKNERRLPGFSTEDTGFDPDNYKGKVAIATIHKAKGLEWDRVYLISVNNYDFPSAQSFDSYIGEKWFIRNQFNLEAEALEKLKSLIADDPVGLFMEEGEATQAARMEYSSERLRLLFVGITRARKSLVITWNTGRPKNGAEARAALPLVSLAAFWKELRNGNPR